MPTERWQTFAAGFREDQIGVATKDPEGAVAKANEKGTKWEEGAGIGILAGAGIGSLVGLGVLSNIIPVVGPVLFTGTMAVLLANAAGSGDRGHRRRPDRHGRAGGGGPLL